MKTWKVVRIFTPGLRRTKAGCMSNVKVEDVITIDIEVVTRGMGEAAMIKALGGEEIYSQMTRKETRRITSGVDSYLPGAERERVWMDCPR
jgi:hypothetical protein